MNKIILLDIDGVLVQPGGYRAALRATVKRFIGDYAIEEDLITSMEKRGISSEWDMSPLIIASYWDLLLSHHPNLQLPDDVSAAAQVLKRLPFAGDVTIPNFELVVGQYPVETAFQDECFQNLPEELRKNLLTESRNVYKSETFRTFQHFTLGSKTYSQTYQLPAEFEAESLLLTEDKSNISPAVIQKLRRHHLSAFTARPSNPPKGASGSSLGYAPEAELALELVGMSDIPLMSFGKLEYIAAQHGLDPATLIKPSPFQALAALLAAWTGDDLAGLNAAHDWHVTGQLNGSFSKLPKDFEWFVVEDTMGGIRAVQAASEILRQHGFGVITHTLGLTSGIPQKAEAFRKADVPHFENWETLIEDVGL